LGFRSTSSFWAASTCGLGGVLGQGHGDLLEVDQGGLRARALLAQIDDVDAVAHRDRGRQLAGAQLLERRVDLGRHFAGADPAGVAAVGRGRRGRELAGHGREGRALLHLGDQLLGAVLGHFHAADAPASMNTSLTWYCGLLAASA
jgi:hypothetical protein